MRGAPSFRGRLRVGIAGLVAALAFAPSLAAANPPIWTVRSDAATLVLFGSVHLLPPGLQWRTRALDDAIARADELWFELPITSESENLAAAATLRRGQLPSGHLLSSLLTPDDEAKLESAAEKLHCPLAALLRMEPWMADLTLSVAEDARAGANASDGVEEQIQALAPASTQRRAFETAPQQIDFLAGAPRPDQIASLNWTLTEVADDPQSYQRIVSEWMAGDIGGLQRDANDTLRRVSPRLFRRLITDRNRRWVRRLSERLSHPGVVVVVVGVGHLIGPEGLPELLRQRGYAVERS